MMADLVRKLESLTADLDRAGRALEAIGAKREGDAIRSLAGQAAGVVAMLRDQVRQG